MRQKKRRRDPSIVYDVTPLFTNVPADETIQLLADKNTTARAGARTLIGGGGGAYSYIRVMPD